jgi:hypothetical protein
MPLDTTHTLSSKGGALPNEVVVIPDATMYTIDAESTVLDLYCMESEDEQKKTVPFLHTIELHGPRGEIVRAKSTFDDGAMINTLNLNMFQRSKHHLEELQWSNWILHMADG